MQRTLVLNVVGLTPRHLGVSTPSLTAFARRGAVRALRPPVPAVTCTSQATFTTGLPPSGHGAVANGWYFRDLSEVWLWRQSNRLIAGEPVWDAAKARDPAFTCAKLFWWWNMYASADLSVTPRPQYPADGRKLPDVYSEPDALGRELQARLGTFPLFEFWGPRAGLSASTWIARASAHVFETRQPTLSLVYLPHLDYDLQRFGPSDPRCARALGEVDALCGELIEQAERAGARVVVLSEYGLTDVTGPVHINRALRAAGLLRVRDEQMGEQLDAGASQAFAVADHQLAHVYVRRPERIAEVAALLRGLEGVDSVWDAEAQRAHGLAHPRSGELVCVSRAERWFTYYFWLDDARAPDYARTVDIHRKPGYDPVELFFDPARPAVKARAFAKLAARKLGFRALLDVIGLDASIVRGSHGRLTDDPRDGPLFATNAPALLGPSGDAAGAPGERDVVDACDVKRLLLRHLFD